MSMSSFPSVSIQPALRVPFGSSRPTLASALQFRGAEAKKNDSVHLSKPAKPSKPEASASASQSKAPGKKGFLNKMREFGKAGMWGTLATIASAVIALPLAAILGVLGVIIHPLLPLAGGLALSPLAVGAGVAALSVLKNKTHAKS